MDRKPSSGAGDGNRTRVTCLEGRCSTIELRRREVPSSISEADTTRSSRLSGPSENRKEEDIMPEHVFARVEPLVGLEPTTY